MSARNGDVEARGFEDFNRSFGGRWEEVVVKSVGPEEDGVTATLVGTAALGCPAERSSATNLPPLLKCLRSKGGNPPMGVDSTCQLREVAQAGKLGSKIHQSRRMRGGSRPQIKTRKRQCIQWTPIGFVVVRYKFRFVGRYIDAHRTIAFAAFAGETKVERFFHRLVLPAIFDDVSFRHLPEQMGAAAGGVLFVSRDAEARTHDSTFVAAALAHSDAAQRSSGQAAVVVGKFEMRLGLPRIISGTEAQVFIEAIRLDELARVHLPIGIPDRLELTEGLHNFRSKHFWKKLGAGLPVSVFARERAAVADDKVGSLFHELAELADAFGGFEIVVHTGVHTGVAEVSVERTFVVEGLHQSAQIAEISAEFFGRDRGVFEAFPAQRFAGNMRSDTEARLADLPNAPGLFLVGEQTHVGRSRGAIKRLHQIARLRFCFGGGVGAELHHQPATAFGQQREAFEVNAFSAARVDHDVVKTFEADGAMLHDVGDVVGTEINIGPSDNEQPPRRRTLDQAAGGFENRDASAFRADESTRHVKAVFGEQVVEVVSGNAARNVGELATNLLSVAVGDGVESSIDFGASTTFLDEAVEVIRAG